MGGVTTLVRGSYNNTQGLNAGIQPLRLLIRFISSLAACLTVYVSICYKLSLGTNTLNQINKLLAQIHRPDMCK